MNTAVQPDIMGMNRQHIPPSALYTAATWRWGGLPYAEVTAPAGAGRVFALVNAYMALYRCVNPQKISLRHNLLHRHVAIDRLLQRSPCQQVMEIAAGFSPRGCDFSAAGGRQYFEIDLPSVVACKRRQLERSQRGREVLARSNFSLVAGDVRSLNLDAAPFLAQPSFIISEGLMMYFTREQQLQIWRQLASFLQQQGGEYVFDYIPLPDEPPLSRLGHSMEQACRRLFKPPPPFAYDARTRFEVADDLRAAGFGKVEVHATDEMDASWSLPYPEVRTRTIIYHCHFGR